MSTKYHVRTSSGQVLGPYAARQIQFLVKAKKVDETSEVSTDQQNWSPISSVPELSSLFGGGLADLPAPKLSGLPRPGGDGNLPRPSGLGLPRPGAPPAMTPPAPAVAAAPPEEEEFVIEHTSVGGQDMFGGGGGDLFGGVGGGISSADLFSGSGGSADDDLFGGSASADPFSAAAAPSAADDDLFGMSAPAHDDLFSNTPSKPEVAHDPFAGASAADDDLFGGGGGAADDDLFGTPAAADDDLFGGAPAASNDDLFGGAPASSDDDLFGGGGADPFAGPISSPAAPAPPSAPPVPSAAPASNDLFSAPAGSGGDDLFGGGIQAGDADLFGDNTDDDDFLGGAQGFSFLDEKPRTIHDDDDEPEPAVVGSNLSEPSLGVSGGIGGQPSAVTEEAHGGTNINRPRFGTTRMPAPPPVANPGAGAPTPESRAPSTPGSAPLTTGGGGSNTQIASTGMPQQQIASTGIPFQGQETQGSAAADDAEKKKKMMMIGIPAGLVLIAAIAAGGWYATRPKAPVKKTVVKEVPTYTIALNTLKKAGHGELSTLIAGAASAKKKEPKLAVKVVLARALAHAYQPNGKTAAALKKDAAALQGDDALTTLARNAVGAVTDKQEEARAALAPLAQADGDTAFFAQAFVGIADVIYIEQKNIQRPKPEEKPPEPAPEEKPEEKPAKKGKKKKGKEKTEEPPAEPETPPEPPKIDPATERIERAIKALTTANSVDAAIPSYWLGRLHLHLGDEDRALEAFKASAKDSPKFTPPRFLMGGLAYRKSELNAAHDSAKALIAQKDLNKVDKSNALFLKGRVEYARAQYDRAIKTLTQAAMLNPKNNRALEVLADSFAAAQTYNQAIETLVNGKELPKKNAEVLLGAVRAYMGLKQWANASARLEQGEKLYPEDARFAYWSGQLNFKRAALYEAEQALKRALEKDANHTPSHALLAHIAWKGKKDAAAGDKHIAELVKHPKFITSEAAALVAEFYAMSGRGPLARSWYQSALRKDLNNWPVRVQLATIALEAEDYKTALKLLEHARDQGVEDYKLNALLADGYRQAKKYDRAIDEINKVLQAKPKTPEYLFVRGRIYFDQGNYPTAREDFNRAYELNTRYHRAYFYVGRTALAEGNNEKAMKIFRHVLDYQQDNGEVRFFMAQVYENQKNDRQALLQYSKIIDRDPGYVVRNPRVFIRRGQIMSKLGYGRRAKKDIQRAVQIAPEMTEALLAMGDIYFREHRYNRSIDVFTRIIAKDPKNPDAHFKLGMSYIQLSDKQPKKREDAAVHLQKALRYGYKDPDIYRTLGYLYKQLRAKDKAIEAFKTFWEKTSNDASISQGTKREVLQQLKELGG